MKLNPEQNFFVFNHSIYTKNSNHQLRLHYKGADFLLKKKKDIESEDLSIYDLPFNLESPTGDCCPGAANVILPNETIAVEIKNKLISPYNSRMIGGGIYQKGKLVGRVQQMGQVQTIKFLGQIGGSDYYQILGVAKNATPSEIKSAYLKLAKKYHPDVSKDPDAENKFKEITAAYQTLSDDKKRQQYDNKGFSFEGFPFDDFPFGGFGNGGFPFRGFNFGGNTASQNLDVYIKEIITLKNVLMGIKNKKVKYKARVNCQKCDGTGSKTKSTIVCPACQGSGRQQRRNGPFISITTCQKCQGAGQIPKDKCLECQGVGFINKSQEVIFDLPKGMFTGMTLGIKNKGHQSKSGATGGLNIQIEVAPDKDFTVSGIDLHLNKKIKFKTAVLGGEITIISLSGKPEKIKIKPGTQVNDTKVIRGLGLPQVNKNTRGDLIIHFNIEIPKNLSSSDKNFLKKCNGC